VKDAVENGKAKAIGRLPAGNIMNLDVVQPLRDSSGLDSLLREIYDPASPSYRHFSNCAGIHS
jgi:hypothetical protein